MKGVGFSSSIRVLHQTFGSDDARGEDGAARLGRAAVDDVSSWSSEVIYKCV